MGKRKISERIRGLERKIAENPIIVLMVVIMAITFIVLLVVSINTVLRKNPYGEEIEIEGLGSIQNLPQDEQDRVKAELYKVVERNLPVGTSVEGVKGKIREGSLESIPGYTAAQYNRQFIVDLEAIQQSYVASIKWNTDKNDERFGDGYPVTVTCLVEPEDLIYPAFDCHDIVTDAVGSTLPLLRYLPKYDRDFSLTATDPSAEKPKIHAALLIHSFETPASQKDQKAEEIKAKVLEFIESVNAEPEDYEIEYVVEYGD